MTKGKPHPFKGEYVARYNDVGSTFTEDEVEFMMTMERYIREHRQPFPDARGVLAVAKALGWKKE